MEIFGRTKKYLATVLAVMMLAMPIMSANVSAAAEVLADYDFDDDAFKVAYQQPGSWYFSGGAGHELQDGSGHIKLAYNDKLGYARFFPDTYVKGDAGAVITGVITFSFDYTVEALNAAKAGSLFTIYSGSGKSTAIQYNGKALYVGAYGITPAIFQDVQPGYQVHIDITLDTTSGMYRVSHKTPDAAAATVTDWMPSKAENISFVWFNSTETQGDIAYVDNFKITKEVTVTQTATSVANGQKGVSLYDPFTVTFDSEAVDEAELAKNVKLLDANGTAVPVTGTWNAIEKKYTITPRAALNEKSQYTLTTENLKDNAGALVVGTGAVRFYTDAQANVLHYDFGKMGTQEGPLNVVKAMRAAQPDTPVTMRVGSDSSRITDKTNEAFSSPENRAKGTIDFQGTDADTDQLELLQTYKYITNENNVVIQDGKLTFKWGALDRDMYLWADLPQAYSAGKLKLSFDYELPYDFVGTTFWNRSVLTLLGSDSAEVVSFGYNNTVKGKGFYLKTTDSLIQNDLKAGVYHFELVYDINNHLATLAMNGGTPVSYTVPSSAAPITRIRFDFPKYNATYLRTMTELGTVTEGPAYAQGRGIYAYSFKNIMLTDVEPVVSASVENEATSVSPFDPITVNFSRPMNSVSGVTLAKTEGGAAANFTGALSADGFSYVITPNQSGLDFNTNYTLTIPAQTSVEGSVTAATTVTFTTAAKPAKVYVSDYTIVKTADQSAVTSLIPGEEIAVSASFSKVTAAGTQKAALIIAVFDANHKLKAAFYDMDKVLTADNPTRTLEATFTVPEGASYINIFAWDSMEDMIPLDGMVRFPNA